MKCTYLLALIAIFAVHPTPASAKDAPKLPPTQAPTLASTLSPDTTVRLLIVDRLKSGTSKKGDRFDLRVDEDVTDPEGKVLIRKGTPAYGTVTQSRKAGLFGKRGLLDITVDYTTSVDGQRVPLRASQNKGGKSNTGVSVAAVVLLAPVALFIKGSNVSVEPGTPLIAFVDDTIRIGAGQAASSPGEESNQEERADEGPRKVLLLRNGDKITGRLRGLADGVYTIDTENGTLKIKEGEVKQISDAPGSEKP